MVDEEDVLVLRLILWAVVAAVAVATCWLGALA